MRLDLDLVNVGRDAQAVFRYNRNISRAVPVEKLRFSRFNRKICGRFLHFSPIEPENRVSIPACGTDSIAFLDCHPQIVYRNFETDFFNDRNVQLLLGKSANPANMLQNYQIPNASESELLIEQTMDYSSIVATKTLEY